MPGRKNRRQFLSKAFAAGALSVLPFSRKALSKKHHYTELPDLKGKSIVFTWGGWEGHEPKKFVDFLTPWMREQGAKLQIFNSTQPYADAALMKQTDLVVQCITMSTITEEEEKGLMQAVNAGVGLAGWHGGLCDSFRKHPKYHFITGGQWVAHPGDVRKYTVNIVDQKDDVTRGLKDFQVKDEQYYMLIDPNVKVLATSTFSGEHADWLKGTVMPVVWKKMYGRGRIFYSSLGHQLAFVKSVPEALEILKRGILWAGASKTSDG